MKSETDICCTSANAINVVNSVDSDEIIWVPDKNLGDYVSKFTGKKMIIWEGYCNTHDMLTVKDVEEMRAQYPNAQFVVHPECRPEVVELGDFVGSTTAIIKYCKESDCKEFIVERKMELVISFVWIVRIKRSILQPNTWSARI